MKRCTMFAVAAMLVCGFAFGADKPGPNYKHLKPMEWIIGTWVLEMEAPEDAPPDSPVVVKKGDPIKVVFTCDWGLNKNIMRTGMKIFLNGDLWSTSEGITGWASDKDQIVASSFDTLGGRGEEVATVNEKSFALKQCEVSRDGMTTNVTTIVTLVDADTIATQRTDITVGGEKQPDEPPVTLRRLKK